jgi:FlaA1/EpsC-like NDP-sugar epimerase
MTLTGLTVLVTGGTGSFGNAMSSACSPATSGESSSSRATS